MTAAQTSVPDMLSKGLVIALLISNSSQFQKAATSLGVMSEGAVGNSNLYLAYLAFFFFAISLFPKSMPEQKLDLFDQIPAIDFDMKVQFHI